MKVPDERQLKAMAQLKGTPVHQMLTAILANSYSSTRLFRDEVNLRWEQGRQQMLCELVEMIEGSGAQKAQPPHLGRNVF